MNVRPPKHNSTQTCCDHLLRSRTAILVGYANAYAGYIPTAEAMVKATYETQASFLHRVDGEAGNRLMAAAAEMIRSELRVEPLRAQSPGSILPSAAGRTIPLGSRGSEENPADPV